MTTSLRPAAPATAPTGIDGAAVAALVLAVTGLSAHVGGLVLCPIALVLGYRARRDISRTGQEGTGLATSAIVLGWVGIPLAFGALLLLIFVGTDSLAYLP